MPCKKRRPAQCHSSHPQRPLIPVSPISMLQKREGPKRPPARCNIEVGVARGARQSFTVGLRPSERAGSRTARIEHNNWGRLRAKLSIRSTHAPGGLVNHFLHLRYVLLFVWLPMPFLKMQPDSPRPNDASRDVRPCLLGRHSNEQPNHLRSAQSTRVGPRVHVLEVVDCYYTFFRTTPCRKLPKR